MKKRFLVKILSGLLAASMIITPVTAYADDNCVPVDTNSEHIETNYSSIGTNEGTVDSNGTASNIEASINNNEGTVTNNYAIITTNDTTGIVDNNLQGGAIITNEGTVENNSSVIMFNNGAIDDNNGKVDWNKGTIDENLGTVNDNLSDGTIEVNNGTVDKNDGTVVDNMADGIVNTNNGTLYSNGGIVNFNNTNGTIGSNGQTVVTNDGTVETNYVIVEENSGTVELNYGTVENNRGTVENNYGTVETNSGTVETNYGTTETNSGTVEANLGTVDNTAGGTVDANYQGIVKGVQALKEFFEYILGIGSVDKDNSTYIDEETDSRTWVGSDQGKENKLTVKAPEGKTLDTVKYDDDTDVNVTDNGDGTWTITGIIKKVLFTWKDKTPDKPSPDKPDPDKPNPDKPDPDKPNPDKPVPPPTPGPDSDPIIPTPDLPEIPFKVETIETSNVVENVIPQTKVKVLVVYDSLTAEENEALADFLVGLTLIKGDTIEFKFVNKSAFSFNDLIGTDIVLNVSKLGAKSNAIIAAKSFNLFFTDEEMTTSGNNFYLSSKADTETAQKLGKVFASLF